MKDLKRNINTQLYHLHCMWKALNYDDHDPDILLELQSHFCKLRNLRPLIEGFGVNPDFIAMAVDLLELGEDMGLHENECYEVEGQEEAVLKWLFHGYNDSEESELDWISWRVDPMDLNAMRALLATTNHIYSSMLDQSHYRFQRHRIRINFSYEAAKIFLLELRRFCPSYHLTTGRFDSWQRLHQAAISHNYMQKNQDHG